jgi:hypothetical protein
VRIGDVVLYNGRPVILLGVEPMSVPERLARVRDCETDDLLDVRVDELQDGEGLAPTA